jgi:toxin ParE1/3/4
MGHKIYATARSRLIEIWEYTETNWGAEQADRYIESLFEELDRIAGGRHRWKPVQQFGFEGVYYAQYRHHFIFFRDLDGVLGVITVLHESMDIPNRLLNDSKG